MLLSMRARARSPILVAAAQWELEGPRMTGPMTSLKILGVLFSINLSKILFAVKQPGMNCPAYNKIV